MEDMNHMEANVIGNELILTWDKKGEYHSGITFEWRNRLIDMKVDVDTTWKSRTDTITINMSGKTSRFGVGRATIGAGTIGKQPKIETLENYLSISQRVNKVTITDNLKEGKPSIFEDTLVFKIINIPSNFSLKTAELLIPPKEECPFMDSSIDRDRLDFYVYKDKKQTIEVSGSNGEHNFIVSYYDSNRPEREDESIYIKKKDLYILCHIFNMKKTCGSELLIILKNKFDGKNYYQELKKFLKKWNVPFDILHS